MIASLRVQTILFSTILLLYVSCSSGSNQVDVPEDIAALENVAVYSGEDEPLYDISFERLARFGDTDDVYIGSIAGIAVSDDGTLFLADQTEAVIHIYDESGEYQTSIGGKGEGPGEFLSVTAPRLVNEELYVLDGQQRRISVFDSEEFNYLRSHPVGNSGDEWGGFPVIAQPLPESQFLIVQNSIQRDGDMFYMRYVPSIYDTEGDSIRTEIVTFQRNPMHTVQSENSIRLTYLPYMSETHIGFTTNNEIVSGYSDRFLFHIVSLEADTLRSIYHSVTPPALDRAEMLADIEDETMRKDIGSMDIPDTRPVYDSIFIDDENRFWVELLTDNREVNRWWVLAENGEKLAIFDRSASSRIIDVKNSCAYFIETDEETGLQEIVKHRYAMAEK